MDSTTHLVGIAIPTLKELRRAVLSSAEPETAVNALREAGYAGGDSVYSAFEIWLGESGTAARAVGDLTIDQFGINAADFFRGAGWGNVEFSSDEGDGLAVLDITDCWEGGTSGSPGCHVTTGVLASFFGRIAGYPVAVLETECCSGDSSRCRFIMGNADVMNYKWDEIRKDAQLRMAD